MNGLMLHCGSKAVDRTYLAAMPLPAALGPRHVVRPYIEDVEIVTQAMATCGLEVVDEAYGVTHDGGRMFGVMEVKPLEGEFLGKDYGLMVGLRGSYDQSITRGLAIGSRVFVCDNLAFGGTVEVRTKQTLNIGERIPRLLIDAVRQIPVMAAHQQRRFDAYRLRNMTPRQGDAMVVELLRKGVISTTQVERVVKEWDEPSHEEHAEDGYTVWRMHNAVTEAVKPKDADRFAIPAIWDRTTKMTSFFDEVVGL